MSELILPRCAVVFRLVGSFSLAFAIHNVYAADPAELPALEITGERLKQKASNISAEELEHYQASDLEDAFSSQPEISVGGGHSVAQKLYMRGLEDTLLSISIDGAQQAGQTFHHTGRINVEPELLKEVDVRAGTTDARWAVASVSSQRIRKICCARGKILAPWSKVVISAMLKVTRPMPHFLADSLKTGRPCLWVPTRIRTITKTVTVTLLPVQVHAKTWASPSSSAT